MNLPTVSGQLVPFNDWIDAYAEQPNSGVRIVYRIALGWLGENEQLQLLMGDESHEYVLQLKRDRLEITRGLHRIETILRSLGVPEQQWI